MKDGISQHYYSPPGVFEMNVVLITGLGRSPSGRPAGREASKLEVGEGGFGEMRGKGMEWWMEEGG